MYCKTCGAANMDSANYCMNDGALLKPNSIKYRLKEPKPSFCPACGIKTAGTYNYCIGCGQSTAQYIPQKSTLSKRSVPADAGPVPKGSTFKLPNFNIQLFKNALLPFILSIVIILALSFSLMKQSEKLYNNLISDSFNEFNMTGMLEDMNGDSDFDSGTKLGSFYGISDIVMMSNLQNPVVTVEGNMFAKMSVELEAKNGFFLYLLIPFIGLFAAGILGSRRNRSSSLQDHLTNAFGIAILYGLFMTIFSLFAGFSFSVDLGDIMAFSINTDYSFIKTLLMTLLFGFIFSGLGSLFAMNFRKVTGHLSDMLPSGEAIHQAIAIPFRGIVLFTVFVFVFIISKIASFKGEYGSLFGDSPFEQLMDKIYVVITTLSVQLGSYLWNLLHFSPLSFTSTDGRQEGSLFYGIFSGIEAAGSARGNTDLSDFEMMLSDSNIDVYLKLAIIIPIGLFLWAGYKLAFRPNVVKNLIIFSLVYAVIMAGLASFSDIGFSISGNSVGDSMEMGMEIGFGPVGTFIRSLLFSFVFAYLGTWINRLKSNIRT